MIKYRSNLLIRLWRRACNRVWGRYSALMNDAEKEIDVLIRYHHELADATDPKSRERAAEKVSALIKRLNATTPYLKGDLPMPRDRKLLGGM